MSEDVFFKCTKCNNEHFPPQEAVALEPGGMGSLSCGMDGCDGSIYFAKCIFCKQLCEPSNTDRRCVECSNSDTVDESNESSPSQSTVDVAAQVNDLTQEIGELKSAFRELGHRLENQISSDKTDQSSNDIHAILEGVTEAAKVARENRQDLSSISSTVAQNRSDILDLKSSLKSWMADASESTKSKEGYNEIVKAYNSLSESVRKQLKTIPPLIESTQQQQVLQQLEIKDELTPILTELAKRLRSTHQNSSLVKVGLSDSLEGPDDRKFANLGDMVQFWMREAQRHIIGQLTEQIENRIGKNKKQKTGNQTEASVAPERLYVDIDGMKSLLDVFADKQSLRMVKDLPELFNAIDDQLSEKQTELGVESENGTLANTVESLSQVQNRLRSWQDHNDIHRFPNEENEAVDYRYHFPLSSKPTADRELDRTIQEVKRTGYVYRDGENEIVLQKAEVVIWEFEEPS